jgi:hypothetical protein
LVKKQKRNQKNQNLKKTSTFAKQTKNYNGKKFGNCRVTSKGKNYREIFGKEFQVESSFGHIADLPSKEIGVDVENGFKPKYEVSPDKKALVTKLKGLAKKC